MEFTMELRVLPVGAYWARLDGAEAFTGRPEYGDGLAFKWTVTSPKTKRYGKAFRVVPIHPELRRYLDESFALAAEGATFCISERDVGKNFRTYLTRLIAKAGLKQWPRVFHALRGSCETDLAARFPLHTVVTWMGTTVSVATKHYLSVTSDDVSRAVAPETWAATSTGPAGVGQGVGQGLSKTGEIGGNPCPTVCPTLPENVGNCAFLAEKVGNPMPPVGVEPTT